MYNVLYIIFETEKIENIKMEDIENNVHMFYYH